MLFSLSVSRSSSLANSLLIMVVSDHPVRLSATIARRPMACYNPRGRAVDIPVWRQADKIPG